MFQEQNPLERRVFIDYSQQSLKDVLLHDENSKSSTLIAHSLRLKQTYDEMKILAEAIQYNVEQWGICGDLIMFNNGESENDRYVDGDARRLYVDLIFFILWDSRCTAEHYIKFDWEPRSR